MFRTVAGLLMSAALAAPDAAQNQSMTDIPGYVPSALELELPRLEARMEEFSRAVEALEDDDGLFDHEREARIEALWTEYGPDVAALGSAAAGFGVTLAGTMVETMDFEAIVEAALSEIDSEAIEAEVAAALAEVEAGVGAGADSDGDAAHDGHAHATSIGVAVATASATASADSESLTRIEAARAGDED